MAGADELNKAKKEAQDLREELVFIADDIGSIGGKLEQEFITKIKNAQDITENTQQSLAKSYSKNVRDAGRLVQEVAAAQLKQEKGLLKQSELQKLKNKLVTIESNKAQLLGRASLYKVELDEEDLDSLKEQEKALERGLKSIEKQNTARGITGDVLDSIKSKVDDIRFADIASAISTFALKALKEFDTEVVNLQRNFSVTKGEAISINQELAKTSLEAKQLGVNLETVTKGTNDLNKALGGTANLFTTDIRNGVAFAEERLGLSAEAASNLAMEAINSGKAFNTIVKENEAAFKSVKATTGVSLNFRQTLEEANKISGALRLNLEATPGGLIEAVAQAKSLGIELEQIKGIQSSILDFESSIAAELEAELLTGKQLNLERARLAALNNDIAGLTQEIASQFGSIEEFQKLNYIQQEAFAGAVGMSSDNLSDILRKQESINNTIQTGVESQGDSLSQNAAALSAQEALAQGIQSLNTILKTSLALIVGIASAAAIIATGGTAAFLIPGLLTGLGAAAATGIGVQAVSDGIAPSSKGPFTITDSYGATAVTSNGDNVVVSPNVSNTSNNDISETNNLLKAILNKSGTVKIDGNSVGTSFSMATYNL